MTFKGVESWSSASLAHGDDPENHFTPLSLKVIDGKYRGGGGKEGGSNLVSHAKPGAWGVGRDTVSPPLGLQCIGSVWWAKWVG